MSPIDFDVQTTTRRLNHLRRRYMPPTSSGALLALYGTSKQWKDNAVWREFQMTPLRHPEVFVAEECRGLAEGLQLLVKALGGKTNPSNLLRFVAAVAHRHLNILGQLESLKRTVFDAVTIHSADPSSTSRQRPLKDHLLHAGCVIDAAVELLVQPGHDGRKLFLCLFEAMQSAYDTVFNNTSSSPNPLRKITGEADRKAFVTDCCLGAVLAHDNGYLPMFELHLGDARVGHLIGILKRTRSARDELKNWFQKVNEEASAQLVEMGGDPAALSSLLPPFSNSWMTDEALREKPDQLHDSVSGYQLLDYFFSSKQTAWNSLDPAEQWMLLMIAGTSIFHGADIFALCNTTLTQKDVNRKQLHDDLAQFDNPVRLALANETDRDDLLRHAAQLETDDGSLLAVLERLNAWIEHEDLLARAEFTQMLQRQQSHELCELLGRQDKKKGEHAKAWQRCLNRLILETGLQGLRHGLDHTLARVWEVNPLGVYLYAVEAMQEWVRLTWETTHSIDTGPKGHPLKRSTPKGDEAERLLSLHLGLHQIEGLKAIIGQSPISKTVIEFFSKEGAPDRTERIEIRYHELEPPDNRFVTQYGHFDYHRITGDFQKERTIPAAMRLITGCPRVDCILLDVTEEALNAVVDELEDMVRTVAGQDKLRELAIPSDGAVRERRRAAVRSRLEHLDVHQHKAYRKSAADRLRAKLESVRESLQSLSVAQHGPSELDKWFEDCLKETSEKFRTGNA